MVREAATSPSSEVGDDSDVFGEKKQLDMQSLEADPKRRCDESVCLEGVFGGRDGEDTCEDRWDAGEAREENGEGRGCRCGTGEACFRRDAAARGMKAEEIAGCDARMSTIPSAFTGTKRCCSIFGGGCKGQGELFRYSESVSFVHVGEDGPCTKDMWWECAKNIPEGKGLTIQLWHHQQADKRTTGRLNISPDRRK